MQEATRAIFTARDEAVAYPNGVGYRMPHSGDSRRDWQRARAIPAVGIVNLMGRHSGFIAAHATMSAGGVDVCLVPEVPFPLEGPNGLLRYLEGILARQGHCVVVVAEGAGQDLLDASAVGTDASGNRGLAEIGPFLKQKIAAHFAEIGEPASPKYVDPAYMVRATAANAADNILCLQLAHDAVHGAFAGYSAFLTGRVNGRSAIIPCSAAAGRRNLEPSSRFWQELVYTTGQPNWGEE